MSPLNFRRFHKNCAVVVWRVGSYGPVQSAGSKDGKLRIEKIWDGEAVEIADPVVADTELQALKEQMEQLFVVELGDPT